MTRPSYFIKFITFIIAVLLIIYLGYQMYVFVNEPVKLTSALMVRVDDAISTEGYFIRDETVLSGLGHGGTIVYAVAPGEKLAKDAAIASYYSDRAAAEDKRQLTEVERKIADFEHAARQASDGTNAARLDQEIAVLTVSLGDLAGQGVLLKTPEAVANLKSSVVRRGLAYEDAGTLEARLVSLRLERDRLAARLAGNAVDVTTPIAGYFTDTVDGFENVLRPDMLTTLSVSDFNGFDFRRESIPQDAIGRVADSYRWYFVACLTEEQASLLTRGKNYRLRFSQMLDETVMAVVRDIRPPEEGLRLVVFEGTRMREEFLSMRSQPVDIILKQYEGIKVPKVALRRVDGEWGAYCLVGQQAVFKKITPVFETESYFIVESSGTKASEIFIYDEIIISGKGIRNKQVVGS